MDNGYVPDAYLVEVEPGKFLESATAAAYRRAKTASNGLLKIASPAGAYRSYAVQVDMKENPERYGIDPALAVGVADPGESSHGFGTRLDLVVGAARTWAVVNLGRFGFRREFGTKDPGHWQYLHPTFAGSGTAPFPTPEDDMPQYELIQTPDGTVWWCVDRVTRYGIPNETALASYQYLLGTKGLPTTILKQGNADAFGSPVYRNGAPATNIAAGSPAVFTDEDLERIAASVEARLQDEFASIPAKVIEEQKKPGN